MGFAKNMMGKTYNQVTGKSNANEIVQDKEYEKALADLARQYFIETAPVRREYLGQGMDVLTGKTEPLDLPAFRELDALNKQTTEKQYGVAKQNILDTLPRGGGLQKALADLETERAQGLSTNRMQLTANLITQILAQLYGGAFGAPGEALAGLGSAAGSYAQRYGATEIAQANRLGSHIQGLSSIGRSFGG